MDEAFRLESLTSSDLPTQFGPFRLLRILGRGAMGRVFEAERDGERLALKVMRPAGSHEGEMFRQVLAKEARLGALLDHPVIVPTRGVGEHEGVPWLTLELIDGVDLSTVLDEWGALAPRVALTIVMELAGALDHAHHLEDAGQPTPVIHRDLKPSNVMLARGGQARLLDFGIAKAAIISGMTTADGQTRGTPRYMSPEQTRGQPLDGRSDLFGLGVLAYEMLAGQRLFEGRSLIEIMSSIVAVERTLARPGVFDPAEEAVPGVAAVLQRCLRANPDHRFERGSELVEALQPLLADVAATPTLEAFVRGVLDGPDDSDSARAEWEAFDQEVAKSGAALDSEKVLRAITGEQETLAPEEGTRQKTVPLHERPSAVDPDREASHAETMPAGFEPALDTMPTPTGVPIHTPASSPPVTPPTNPPLEGQPEAFAPTERSMPSQPGALRPSEDPYSVTSPSMASRPGALPPERPGARSGATAEPAFDQTDLSTVPPIRFNDTPPPVRPGRPSAADSVPPGPNPFAEVRSLSSTDGEESPLWWVVVGVAALAALAVLWLALGR